MKTVYLVYNSRIHQYIYPLAAFLDKEEAKAYCKGKLYMCMQEVKLK